jgi:hypothetical protein
MTSLSHPVSIVSRKGVEVVILALVAAAAFLLGCYEMADSDVWWHISGGRWILAHGRVPGLDPFTFGSADRLWVDIHWGFEVLLALAYRSGGVAALVLIAATAGCGAVAAAVTARRRNWPAAVTVLCWLPTLVLVSWRFDPRPEIFSLLYLSLFLAVLWRADRRPAIAWLLVPLQILWVNTQGLFVLGPVVTGLFVAARAARLAWQRWHGKAAATQKGWWRHVGGAALAVGVAVLVNPYFLDGARFPFDLYPKVAQKDNPYKQYIDELASPRELVDRSHGRALDNWYIRTLYLLLLAVPASFLLPAAWRAWTTNGTPASRRPPPAGRYTPRAGAWLGGAALLGAILLAGTIGLPYKRVPPWVAAVGRLTPLVLAAGAAVAAALLWRRSRAAAVVAAVGGAALAIWAAWLRGYFLAEAEPAFSGPTTPMLTAAAVAGVVLWQGADLFRLLLAGAFGYLALQAQQNDSRFALVAGLVLSWNLGEWAVELAAGLPGQRWVPASGWAFRLGVAGLLIGLIGLVVTDRYGQCTGEVRHFTLAEQPFEFAHDAVRFAGSPGLPEHALVYDLGQTGLYDFYHGPERKPFLDGRLEMPALETFRIYVEIDDWLGAQDPRWAAAVERLGKPLILLTHPRSAAGEAMLLTDPGWRCIYYDALASVFVPRGEVDESAFPTIDFAAQHFRDAGTPSVPDLPGSAYRELFSLARLGTTLQRRPDAMWQWRIPVLLRALDRGERALTEAPERQASTWTLLGDCHWGLVESPQKSPPQPGPIWDTAALLWAQATYCYRRSLELVPEELPALRALYDVFRLRGMADALLPVGEQLIALQEASPEQVRDIGKLRRAGGPPRAPVSAAQLPAAVSALVSGGWLESAVRLVEEAEARGGVVWTWPLAEAVGSAYLHLGRPGDARRAWQRCSSPPSEAVRLCRLAQTHWVERDFEKAAASFEEARRLDGQLGEACWGLAVLEAQWGRAGSALRACREGLARSLTESQRADLRGLQPLLARLAPQEDAETK